MSMQYIRQRYGVPAKRGARIRYTGLDEDRLGTIVGSDYGAHLRIRLDGDTEIASFHPTWEIKYLDTTLKEAIAAELAKHTAEPMKLHKGGYKYECECGHTEQRGEGTGLKGMFNQEWEHHHQAEMLTFTIQNHKK